MYQRILDSLNRLAVAVYKSLGSALLVLILLGLFGYLARQAFFVASRSWVMPVVVSASDPKVLELEARFAEQSASRDRIAGELREKRSELARIEQELASERAFQEQFSKAIDGERRARGRELERLAQVRRDYARMRQDVLDANRAYGARSRHRARALRAAGLLDQEQFLTANFQFAQIAQADFALEASGAELEGRGEKLLRELRGLEVLSGVKVDAPVPPELLTLKQAYVHSQLATLEAERARDDVNKALEDLAQDLARYDRLQRSIRDSPYLKAADGGLTVAFAPYANLSPASVGERVFACRLLFFWCREVGRIDAALPGEITMQHPGRRELLRGVMLKLTLTEPEAAKQALLHVGHPPIGI